jgi:hypothetical protein
MLAIKKLLPTWSQEKREQYKEIIKYISPQNIVYIEERSIDMTMCKGYRMGKKERKI